MKAKWMPESFESAEKVLGGKKRKKIGNNTELRQEEDTYVVKHFYTDIVRYHADGDVDFNLSYASVSTKVRLNRAHPAVRIFHRGGVLYVSYKGTTFPAGNFFRTSEASDNLCAVE